MWQGGRVTVIRLASDADVAALADERFASTFERSLNRRTPPRMRPRPHDGRRPGHLGEVKLAVSVPERGPGILSNTLAVICVWIPRDTLKGGSGVSCPV